MSQLAESARAAGKVSMAVFVSRVLGLVRDQVFAKLFGAGLYNDAWLVAFRIPNLLRDLFAEGALSSAFVPTFTEWLHRRGRGDAWLLANLVLSWLLIILGALALAFLFLSRFFVYFLAAGFGEVPGKVEITALLLQIMSPFLLLIGMASVAMGILNTLNHYFLPALAPALFNLAVILAGLFLAPRFEAWGILPIHAMAVGAVAGGMLQYAVQAPLLRRHGFRLRFQIRVRHPGIQRIARLMAPALVGVSAVQLNVLVNTQIASFLQENGPVSWLSYAFRILYLPIGLFGVAMGVVNLREVSLFAAQQRWDALKETVANSIKLVAVMAIPSTVGLVVLASPIIRILFERGDFTASDTRFTAYALVLYSLGLFAYSCNKIYIPTFYALDDIRTPVRVSLIAVFGNLIINLFLVFVVLPQPYRYTGLALGTALSVTISNMLLAGSFRRRMGSLRAYAVGRTVIKASAAALVMGPAVYGLDELLRKRDAAAGFLQELAALGTCIVGGAVIYFACCHWLRLPETRQLFRRLRR